MAAAAAAAVTIAAAAGEGESQLIAGFAAAAAATAGRDVGLYATLTGTRPYCDIKRCSEIFRSSSCCVAAKAKK